MGEEEGGDELEGVVDTATSAVGGVAALASGDTEKAADEFTHMSEDALGVATGGAFTVLEDGVDAIFGEGTSHKVIHETLEAGGNALGQGAYELLNPEDSDAARASHATTANQFYEIKNQLEQILPQLPPGPGVNIPLLQSGTTSDVQSANEGAVAQLQAILAQKSQELQQYKASQASAAGNGGGGDATAGDAPADAAPASQDPSAAPPADSTGDGEAVLDYLPVVTPF